MSKTDNKEPNMMLPHRPLDILQHSDFSILLVIERSVLVHRQRIVANSEDTVMGRMVHRVNIGTKFSFRGGANVRIFQPIFEIKVDARLRFLIDQFAATTVLEEWTKNGY